MGLIMDFLDSWVFLEFYSEGEKAGAAGSVIRSSAQNAVISTVILTEIKYRIAKKFDIWKANDVISTIESIPNLRIIPTVAEIAKLAAELRIKYYSKERQISYFDCINLATAIIAGCKKFYTGDPDFKGVEEIEVVVI